MRIKLYSCSVYKTVCYFLLTSTFTDKMDLKVKTKVWFLTKSPCNTGHSFDHYEDTVRWRLDQTIVHMRWKAGCARKHLDMAYLAWTRTGQKGKVYPAHFLSQRTFMLTPLPQASCKVSFQPRCYSLFSGQVPYVWIIFMKHSDL